MRRRNRHVVPQLVDWSVAAIAGTCQFILRCLPRDASIALAGRTAGAVARILPRYRTAMKNLKRAFPEKTEGERRKILAASWNNLARTTVEYAFLDQVFRYRPDKPDAGNIEVRGIENFVRLREQTKPAIIFTGHLGNWELLSICAAQNGLDVTSMYRVPNNRYIANAIIGARSKLMGPMVSSGNRSLFELTAALERGGHVGLLADQRYKRGILVPFFGHPAETNPLIAKLARQYDCSVHGARSIRLANQRFRLEITDPIDLPRDVDGDIDVAQATAAIQDVLESWIREYPEQWMWVHRRWRTGRKSRLPATLRDGKDACA